jgi:hypothetical protein
MALRNTAKTEAVIAQRLREGRGQGLLSGLQAVARCSTSPFTWSV